MPKCYLLAVAGGSSLDQHSNNVTLFNLVEQLNFPKQSPPPPGAVLPLEVHAYFELAASELNQYLELRFVLVGTAGLETPTEVFKHRSATMRYRIRSFGLPVPPTAGSYSLCVDFRLAGGEGWKRDGMAWPLLVVYTEPRPTVTH